MQVRAAYAKPRHLTGYEVSGLDFCARSVKYNVNFSNKSESGSQFGDEGRIRIRIIVHVASEKSFL